MGERDWELWDAPGVADAIEKAWQCEGEISYRKILLGLVSRYVRDMDRFLEIGCGTGRIYRYLTEIVKVSYTGVDCSEEMLKIARASFPEGNFQKGDAYNLQFPDGSFDAVAAIDVLQHVPDIVGIIREMVRVSRNKIIFTISGAPATKPGKQVILGQTFLWNRYSTADATAKVKEASGGIYHKMIPITLKEAYGKDLPSGDELSVSNLWVLSKAPF